MKYILMMNGTKANFAEYAKWSKKDHRGDRPRFSCS
jgi:hypothetical protein